MQSLNKEQLVIRDREQSKTMENAELSARLGEMEKARYSAEAELKAVTSKYDQLVKSQSANETDIINNHHEANMEQVKSEWRCSSLKFLNVLT